MKRIIFFVAAVLALYSCDKDQKGSSTADKKVTKVEVVCNVKALSQDILDNCDFVYNYTDFDGNKKSVPMTKAERILFSIDNPVFDGENLTKLCTVEVKATPKGEFTKSTYNMQFNIEIGVNGYYSDGSLITDSYDLGAHPNIRTVLNHIVTTEVDFKKDCGKLELEEKTFQVFYSKLLTGGHKIGADIKQK